MSRWSETPAFRAINALSQRDHRGFGNAPSWVAERVPVAAPRAERAALVDGVKAANTATARARVEHDRAVAEAGVVAPRRGRAPPHHPRRAPSSWR